MALRPRGFEERFCGGVACLWRMLKQHFTAASPKRSVSCAFAACLETGPALLGPFLKKLGARCPKVQTKL